MESNVSEGCRRQAGIKDVPLKRGSPQTEEWHVITSHVHQTVFENVSMGSDMIDLQLQNLEENNYRTEYRCVSGWEVKRRVCWVGVGFLSRPRTHVCVCHSNAPQELYCCLNFFLNRQNVIVQLEGDFVSLVRTHTRIPTEPRFKVTRLALSGQIRRRSGLWRKTHVYFFESADSWGRWHKKQRSRRKRGISRSQSVIVLISFEVWLNVKAIPPAVIHKPVIRK